MLLSSYVGTFLTTDCVSNDYHRWLDNVSARLHERPWQTSEFQQKIAEAALEMSGVLDVTHPLVAPMRSNGVALVVAMAWVASLSVTVRIVSNL